MKPIERMPRLVEGLPMGREESSGGGETPQKRDCGQRQNATQHPQRAILGRRAEEPVTLEQRGKQSRNKQPEQVGVGRVDEAAERQGAKVERGNNEIFERARGVRQFPAEPHPTSGREGNRRKDRQAPHRRAYRTSSSARAPEARKNQNGHEDELLTHSAQVDKQEGRPVDGTAYHHRQYGKQNAASQSREHRDNQLDQP